MQVRTSERIIRAEWRYRVRTGVLEYSNLHTTHILPKPSSSSSSWATCQGVRWSRTPDWRGEIRVVSYLIYLSSWADKIR